MIICGLKITHDGTIALVDGSKLIFSVELEKLNNNPRYIELKSISDITGILSDFGYDTNSIDKFIIDGWQGEEIIEIPIKNGDKTINLKVAPYEENSLDDNILKNFPSNGLEIDGKSFTYDSYPHAAGHLCGVYCASPFMKRKEDSYVLVWDGGMFPRLYFINNKNRSIKNFGPLFSFIGHTYAIFAMHFRPYYTGVVNKYNLSVAGKVMAYNALGTVKEDILEKMNEIYNRLNEPTKNFGLKFSDECKTVLDEMGYRHRDILASFHVFLERILLSHFEKFVGPPNKEEGKRNLCMVGGCALNIKWNSAIRNSGLFDEVWVPPFTNDTGSAIGAICCELFKEPDFNGLDWDFYSGPNLIKTDVETGWTQREFCIEELANLIHTTNEPVVFLNGRTELGPRALGNRSILAAAVSPKMKEILNRVKIREEYRPIAPICLLHKASTVFNPGGSDPFMLFDHKVHEDWLDRVPAITHLDKTARIQTVSEADNPLVYKLLTDYEKLSGVPLLCNTSANLNGSGFFPSTGAAMQWGRLNYVWSDNILYEKIEKVNL